jgi:predicted phage terminase large subunit-like protein
MSVMLIDAWQDRLQYPDLRPKVIEEYDTVFGDGREKKRVDLILVEDKSAGISLIQDLQRAHLPVRAYNPGKADKVQRLNIVANIIARGRVWIPESSKRKGFVRDWAEGFVSQICSFPETTHDDFVDSCLDSCTQIQMARGTKAIKDVQVGDMVMTPNGLRRVTAVHDNGRKEVWEVIIGSRRILATAEHRVMTTNGWKRVDCLSQSVDNGYIIRGERPWHFLSAASPLRRLSSMASDTTDTLRALIQRIGGTLRGLGQDSTGTSGSFTMARFRRVCTFTILTVTRPITTSAIWLASHAKSIGSSTSTRSQLAAKLQSTCSTLIASGRRLLDGISRRPAKSGTGSTHKSLWPRRGASLVTCLTWPFNAFGAALASLGRARDACFARAHARTPSLSSGSVSRVINTHTTRHVFDLTVEEEHCYFANGVLVHNCTQALRFLRDAGWLEIDPPPRDDWDDEDFADTGRPRRVNPYAV